MSKRNENISKPGYHRKTLTEDQKEFIFSFHSPLHRILYIIPKKSVGLFLIIYKVEDSIDFSDKLPLYFIIHYYKVLF